MSLDDLARRLEANAGIGSKQEDMRYKVLMEYLSAGANMDSKTSIPDAAAFAAAEYLLDWIGEEYGDEFKDKLMNLLKKFKVLKPTENNNARDQVERMMKALKDEETERGKSIIERLNKL